MSGELNTDNTDATGFSQMAVVTTPSLGRVRGGSVPFGSAKIRHPLGGM